jgi:hypothetical protein
MPTLLFLLSPCLVFAQAEKPAMHQILDRLDRLEKENATLRDEVRQLKDRLDQSRPEEKLEIQERRIEEQAQTKVEASQRFPLRITGMALFNTFWSGRNSNGQDIITSASLNRGRASWGGSVRQSVIGIQFDGPTAIAGARVHGSMFADFYNGSLETSQLGNFARVRTASIELEWERRSLTFGQEKPIFAPREPNSLATVGISPLTGAGNLWRWHPQIKYEERIPFTEATTLTAQVGLFQTQEDVTQLPASIAASIERRRPGLQGRFELAHTFDQDRRIEFAPGFHFSTTHAGGLSIPSRVFSLDWFATPFRQLQISGAFFDGRNLAHFGAQRQSLSMLPDGQIVAVHSRGGWGQFSLLLNDRITWNFFGGVNDDRNSDLITGNIGQNRAGASNLMFRIAPNVIVSLEALQMRSRYLGTPGKRINNRYDLAVAYQF